MLTCKISSPHTTCIPMSDFTFSLVTSIFTVGGLAGSLFANLVMDKWGRRGSHQICVILIASGTTFMGLSHSVSSFLLGRLVTIPQHHPYHSSKNCPSFLMGMASGLGLCAGPIYLAEIAPSCIRGTVGRSYYYTGCYLGLIEGIRGSYSARNSPWYHVHTSSRSHAGYSVHLALRVLHFVYNFCPSIPFQLHDS